MRRMAGLAALIVLAGAMAADGQTATKADGAVLSPVAAVRQDKSWEYGPFVNGGLGMGDRSDFYFASAGFEVGKPVSRVLRAGAFSGQLELGANIMPFWQAYTPSAHMATFHDGNLTYQAMKGGGTYRGFAMTPVIFRWNFLTRSPRVQTWAQAAGGLVYTTHKFPGVQMVAAGTPGGTSVWNFEPQGGIGAHIFTAPKRSIDVGLNAVHISSASLGDRNPGVNASLQLQIGYTFWK